MSLSVPQITALIAAINQLVLIFWRFVIRRNAYDVHDAINVIQGAASDEVIRNALSQSRIGKRTLDAIEKHGANVSALADAGINLNRDIKVMLYETRMILEARKSRERYKAAIAAGMSRKDAARL